MKANKMIYQKERKIELLYNGKYKNYKYYILNLGTHPTAYIAIPKGHKLYGQDYYDIYNICYIDVHGGLTYSSHNLMGIDSDDWFIGWDYAHADDYMGYYTEGEFLTEKTIKWTTEEIIKECHYVINQIDEVEILDDEDEEKKVPEQLENKIDESFKNYNYSERRRLTEMVEKINEILDYLEKQSKGE